MYKHEFDAMRQRGLSASCLDITNIKKSQIYPALPSDNHTIVYRGWMLDKTTYTELEDRFGTSLVTSHKSYLDTHYLPSWYPDLQSLTIPSIVTDEEHVQNQFQSFPGKAFIKDYVKSLKTGKGSIVDSYNDIQRAIADMKFYRGSIEGGIVLREVVSLKPSSETRFFVAKNKIFSPKEVTSKEYSLAEEVVKKLEHKNLAFYSIDIATTIEEKPLVIEIGDGQVSDYVGWELNDFLAILCHLAT